MTPSGLCTAKPRHGWSKDRIDIGVTNIIGHDCVKLKGDVWK